MPPIAETGSRPKSRPERRTTNPTVLAHGSLQHKGGDTWKLVVYAGINPRTHKQQARTKTFKASDHRAAVEMAQRLYGGLMAAVGEQRAQRGTVAELAVEWVDHNRATWSPSTLQRNEGIVKRIVAELGREPLERLNARQIDAWYGKLRKQGLSPATVRHYHRILNGMLKQGELWDMVDRIATNKARPPAAAKYEADPPPSALLMDMLNDTKGAYGVALWLLAASGARRGEVVGLRWSDIDTARNEMKISRAIVETQDPKPRIGREAHPPVLHVAPPKGKRARVVSLDPEGIMPRLATHLIAMEAQARDLNGKLTRESYIFADLRADPNGRRPMAPSWLTRAWNRVRARHGSPARLHDLRHWHASTLIAEGRPLPEVSKRLGHAQVSTTSDVYAHVVKGADRASADVMSRILK